MIETSTVTWPQVAAQGRAALSAKSDQGPLKGLTGRWKGPLPTTVGPPDWVAAGTNVDLSWLHFALWKHYDRQG